MTARIVGAVVALALGSAACGSTGTPTDSQAGAPPTSAAGPASTMAPDVTTATETTSPTQTQPPAASGAVDTDPCGLLTADELAALLGSVVVPEAEDDLPTDVLRQCTWFAEDHPDFLVAGISVQVMRRPSDLSGVVGADMMGFQLKPVSGLGEEAYIGITEPDPDFGVGESVAVVVTARDEVAIGLGVMIDVAEGTPEYDILLDLARTALERA
ncbi:hypothetical protein BH23ACT5_BH23ACT5_01590 [soil metagenome]